jgi:hypothetical protein
MAYGNSGKSEVIPDPAIAVIVLAGPNRGFFMGEILYRFASIRDVKSLLRLKKNCP